MQKILDDTKCKQVVAVLAIGGSRTLAAKVVGCHPRTIYNAAKADPTFAEKLNQAEGCPEYNMLQSLYESRRIPHVNKWGLERIYPDSYRPRKPGTFSVDAVKQLLGLLAARLAEQAASDHERRQILETIAETAREIMFSTQPFVDQAIAMRKEFDSFVEEIGAPSAEPAAASAVQDSSLPAPIEEEPHAQ